MDVTPGAQLPFPEGDDVPRIADELTDLARAIDPRGFQRHDTMKRAAAANTPYTDLRGLTTWVDDNTGNIWVYIGRGTAVGSITAPDSPTRTHMAGWVLLADLLAQHGNYIQTFNVGALPINLEVDVLGGSFAGPSATLTAPPTGTDGRNNAYQLPATPAGRKYRIYFSAWVTMTPDDSGDDWDLAMRLGKDLNSSKSVAEAEGPKRGADWTELPMTSYVASAGDIIKWEVLAIRRAGNGNVNIDQAEDLRGAWVVAWPEETAVSFGTPSLSHYATLPPAPITQWTFTVTTKGTTSRVAGEIGKSRSGFKWINPDTAGEALDGRTLTPGKSYIDAGNGNTRRLAATATVIASEIRGDANLTNWLIALPEGTPVTIHQ